MSSQADTSVPTSSPSIKLAITGTTGRIGSAVLLNLLSPRYMLLSAADLLVLTSTSPNPQDPTNIWTRCQNQGIQIRHANYSSPSSLSTALQGVERFILVSTPAITMDYSGPNPPGRESHHINALEAARTAGVKHVYYTSLAFYADRWGERSKAGVMRAHLETEAYLKEKFGSEEDMGWTSLRMGIYSESWPLYLGHFDPQLDRQRTEVRVCGQGRIAWTEVDDLGLATAVYIVGEDTRGQRGKVVPMSATRGVELRDLGDLVAEKRRGCLGEGEDLRVRVVGREEHERYYAEERGLDEGMVRWWAGTFEAMADGELENGDGTLEGILLGLGRKPVPVEETVERMVVGWYSS